MSAISTMGFELDLHTVLFVSALWMFAIVIGLWAFAFYVLRPGK